MTLSWSEAIDIMSKNKKKKVNARKGIKGFSKNNWDENDRYRLLEIHSAMQKYKATRPHGLKYIDIAHHQFHSGPDKK